MFFLSCLDNYTELMRNAEDPERDDKFYDYWDCNRDTTSMLEATRKDAGAYTSFIALIAQAMIGSSKWRRFLDIGQSGTITLEDTVSCADEAFALLALENSRDKWNEEAAFRRANNMTAFQKLEKGIPKTFVKAKYSENEATKLNEWDEKGVTLCGTMQRRIMEFRPETTVTQRDGTMNTQTWYEKEVKKTLCTQYSKSRSKQSSPQQHMEKRQKMDKRENSLQMHCFNFSSKELIGVSL